MGDLIVIGLTLLIIYLSGVLIAFGMDFAFAQGEWPDIARKDYVNDIKFAALVSILSWVWVLVLVANNSHGYGIKFK